jgi:hypothetical protein
VLEKANHDYYKRLKLSAIRMPVTKCLSG